MFHKGVIISKSDCCSSVGFPDLQDTQVTLWSGSEYRFPWPPPHGFSGMLSWQVLDPDTQGAPESLLQKSDRKGGMGQEKHACVFTSCSGSLGPRHESEWWPRVCYASRGPHLDIIACEVSIALLLHSLSRNCFLRAGLWTTEDNHLYWILFLFCFWAQTLFTHFIYQASVQVAFDCFQMFNSPTEAEGNRHHPQRTLYIPGTVLIAPCGFLTGNPTK